MTNPSALGPDTLSDAAHLAKPPHTREAILKIVPPFAGSEPGPADLNEILTTTRPRMFAVALRMTRNPDDAEDVVQEAMVKVWRGVDRFEGRAALPTWIHRIVVNCALDRLRARGPAAAFAGRVTDGDGNEREGTPEGDGCAEVETPEELVRSAQVAVKLHHALDALPAVQRQVLALRELEGESYQSIADIVRCPIGTVMSRLHHARHRLAEEISANHRELVPRAA